MNIPASAGVTTRDEKSSATAMTTMISSSVVPEARASPQSKCPSSADRKASRPALMSPTISARVASMPRNLPAMNSQRATGLDRMLRMVRLRSSWWSMVTPRTMAMITPNRETLIRLKSLMNFIWSPIDAAPNTDAMPTTTRAKNRIE